MVTAVHGLPGLIISGNTPVSDHIFCKLYLSIITAFVFQRHVQQVAYDTDIIPVPGSINGLMQCFEA